MASVDVITWILQSAAEHPDGRPTALEEGIVRQMIEEGRARCEAAAGTPIEPPSAPDRFAETTGLPEIPASDLDAQALASGLLHHGALLVRGLYGDAQLARLRRASTVQERHPRGPAWPASCSANSLLEMVRSYEESGLLRALRGYLGGAPVVLPRRAKLRFRSAARGTPGGLPWHQDVNFFGSRSYAVNCWAAVTPCGEETPGVVVIPRRVEERHGWSEQDGIAPLTYGMSLSDELIRSLSHEHPIASPVLQPGDALLFDEMTMHRSGTTPWLVDDQLVTITWFFRPAGFPPGMGAPLAV